MTSHDPRAKRTKVDHAQHNGESKRILEAPIVSCIRPEWFREDTFDPEIVAINQCVIRESSQTPELPEVGVAATRTAKANGFVHGKHFEDLLLPSIDGKETVGARLFTPADDRIVHAALLHIHGGGFISGSAFGQNDTRLESLCDTCGLAVLSVDYRLAPEHVFPAASDDCLAAARWLATVGRIRLGCKTLLLVGESSGGNLAASLLLRLRDEGLSPEQSFAAVCLVYGIYDASLTPSARNWGERRLICNTRELEWWVRAYVGGEKNLYDPRLSPLHGNLHGLPPALFVVGTEDALLDDSLFMHARWAAAGNESSLALFPGAPHGVGHFGPHKDTEQGKKVRAAIEAFYMHHIPTETILLENEKCVLSVLVTKAPEPSAALHANEYWLVIDNLGQLSATLRSNEATALPMNAKEVRLLRLRSPPLQTLKTSFSEALPGDGVDIGTRLLLSDSRVNIWEFLLRPGESCAYHRHRLPYLFTNLTASLTQALLVDGTPMEDCGAKLQRKGQTTFVGLDALGAHGVRNVGDGDFLQFIVEFK